MSGQRPSWINSGIPIEAGPLGLAGGAGASTRTAPAARTCSAGWPSPRGSPCSPSGSRSAAAATAPGSPRAPTWPNWYWVCQIGTGYRMSAQASSALRTHHHHHHNHSSQAHSTIAMSQVSDEEKRRLLRERRQAKMAKGQASERLNNILSQGSSTKASAVLVLDKPTSPAPEPTAVDVVSGNTSATLDHHDDPEVPDISTLAGALDDPQDLDALMQKVFGAAGDQLGQQDPASKFFADMMKTMAEDPGAFPEMPGQDASYQTKVDAYHEYQQKAWYVRFLMVRVFVHVSNFVYHFATLPYFRASPFAYIRAFVPPPHVRHFINVFLSAEVVIISSYFAILANSNLLTVSSRKHPLSKLLGMGSALVPHLAAYQPLLDKALVYWGGASILLGDLMLLVVMFGITSTFF